MTQSAERVARSTNPWLVLGICSTALFMNNLDTSVLNVAVPAIQRTFHSSLADLQWVTDAYLLVLSSFLLAAGSLGDRYGRRRIFESGLVLFLAGSLACSMAPNTGSLVAFRMLQAVGGSALVPSALSIITHTFTEARARAKALGFWSASMGVAVGIGPFVGGVLVETGGWRLIFWVNVPVVTAAFALARRYLPESKAARARRIDVPGQILIIAALATLTYAFIDAPVSGWGSSRTIAVFVLAGALFVIFTLVELSRRDPLLEIRLLRTKTLAGASFCATLIFSVFSGFLFLNTIYLQEVRGESPLVTGLALLPATVLIVLVSPLAGRIVARFGPRAPLVTGALVLVGSAVVLASITEGSSYLVLALAYLLLGTGFALTNPPITTIAVAGLPLEQAGVASAIASVTRQVGNVLGIAVMGSLLSSELSSSLRSHLDSAGATSEIVQRLVAAGVGAPKAAAALHIAGSPRLVEATKAAYVSAQRPSWWLAAGACALVAAIALLVASSAPGLRSKGIRSEAVAPPAELDAVRGV